MLDSIKPPKAPNITQHAPLPEKPKRRFRIGLAIVMLVLLAAGIFVGSKFVIFAQKILEGKGVEFSFRRFFLASDKKLIGEDKGEIHLLLLGIGGVGHEGPNLTDTIILATIKIPQEKNGKAKVGLYSVPRDLVVNIPGYDYRKINSAYAYGSMKGEGEGAKLAINAVQELLDIDIPYYAVVDFRGFEKVIDDVGGINVDVERKFTDYQYPDEKNGYLPPVAFEVGPQMMDGKRALEYVRSRHGDNDEGTDFARSRRQQKVLKALRDKVSTFKVLSNLSLVDRILSDIADHFRTNLQLYEMKRIYDLTKDLGDENISTTALDVESGILCNQIAEDTGAYILLPCTGLADYGGIRNLFRNQFVVDALQKEQAKIEIQTLPKDANLAQTAKDTLNLPSINVTTGNLKSSAAYEESIIYDNTNGAKPETLKYLQAKLGVRLAGSPFPFTTTGDKVDFVIILTSNFIQK